MRDTKRLLKGTDLFGGLGEHEIEQVAALVKTKIFHEKDMIFFEGERGDHLYIISSGRIKIFKVSLDGKEHILHIFGPGEPFGEVPVLSGGHYPASAQALEECSLMFLKRDDFKGLIRKNPDFAMKMLAVLSKRLRVFAGQIEGLSLKDLPSRLASHLLYLTKKQQNHKKVSLLIPKTQLASLLGTVPETLSRVFAKMASRLLIRVEGKDVLILDYAGLKELAESGKLDP